MKKEDSDDFSCERCGKCCQGSIVGSLQAMVDDIKRWRDEGREDILLYVDQYDIKDADWCSCDIWVSPITRRDLTRCPFLRKIRNKDEYKCSIHETKPKWCREYPIIKDKKRICLRMKEEQSNNELKADKDKVK